MGSFVLNVLVGAAQLFTVIFCLVGWGWSIWWGLIILRIASECETILNISLRLTGKKI